MDIALFSCSIFFSGCQLFSRRKLERARPGLRFAPDEPNKKRLQEPLRTKNVGLKDFFHWGIKGVNFLFRKKINPLDMALYINQSRSTRSEMINVKSNTSHTRLS